MKTMADERPSAAGTPVASVVIPCRNHAEELARCLRSLEDQSVGFEWETVVVDSASDPEVARVVRNHKDVHLVRSEVPLLAGAARNLGVRNSSGEYIVFIDADCRAEAGWLATAISALRGDNGLEMVGGPVLDARPLHPIAVADNLLQFSDFLPGRPDGAARYFPSCNMAVRRAAFVDVEGFKDHGITTGHDTALCEAFLERWPRGLRFVSAMRVRHDGRATLRQMAAHHASFGYARGARSLHITPEQRRLARRAALIPATAAKRFSYLVRRNFMWDFPRALRMVPLFPILALGLVSWSIGFRKGCRVPLGEGDGGGDVPR